MSDPTSRLTEDVQRAKAYVRKEWHGWFAAFVAVVLILTAVDAFVVGEERLRGLLIPSLAALSFFLFTRPTGPDANLRGIVVAPVIGAVIGLLGTIAQTRVPQFIVVLVDVSAAMLMMHLLDVAVASVLVMVLLPIIHGTLTGPSPGEPQHNPFPIYTYWYPVWILVYTGLLFLIFKAWRRSLPSEERAPRRT
jgi:CBS-domain-containing membrane protein